MDPLSQQHDGPQGQPATPNESNRPNVLCRGNGTDDDRRQLRDEVRAVALSIGMTPTREYEDPHVRVNEEFRTTDTTSSFNTGPYLGSGAYGAVCVGVHKVAQFRCALKFVRRSKFKAGEVYNHAVLRHFNILQIYGHFYDAEFMAVGLILEYAEGGELHKRMLNSHSRHFDEPTAANYMAQLTFAVQYMHSMDIVHRDIKPDNILLGALGELKLADFGLSKWLPQGGHCSDSCGTAWYMAPEMVKHSPGQVLRYGKPADIWAMGVVLFEFLDGDTPFQPDSAEYDSDDSHPNLQSLFTRAANLEFYRIPDHFSPEVMDLLSRLIVVNPAQRLTPEGVLRHPWILKHCSPDPNATVLTRDMFIQNYRNLSRV